MRGIGCEPVSDEHLADLAKGDDPEAYGELISRCLPSVRRLARIYAKTEADRDDLVSEGILGVMSAIKTYDEKRGAAFSTYAGVCANRRMLSALKKSARIRDREEPIEDMGESGGTSPEKIVIDREALGEIFSEIEENLTDFERSVFAEYLSGASYSSAAEALGVDRKAIDNALSRVRRKLRRKFR